MTKLEGFTPGKWTWRGTTGGRCKIVADYGTPGMVEIAEINQHLPVHERTRNMLLIAAAPALLAENERLRAALENLIEACMEVSYDSSEEGCTHDFHIRPDDIDAARAALRGAAS